MIANRTPARIDARMVPVGGTPYPASFPSGDSVPLFTDKPLRIEFLSDGVGQRFKLDANSAYFFGETQDGRLGLQKIGLGGAGKSKGRPLPGEARLAQPAVITVKLLVDEEEALRREVWERRLRERAAKASVVLERHAGVRLRVVAVDEWRSSNDAGGFFKSLEEFEQAVDPAPARLAIGFSSQYEAARGRTHLGGIRGPLRRHIMIREWSRVVSEPEKLELLVHELGHFLGATHSPEPDSVMRPVLGDRQSRMAGFRVRFDPVNTLLISMVGEELRRRGVTRFDQMTPGTRSRLAEVYGVLTKAIPGDRSAAQFLQISRVKTPATSFASQAGGVLQAITLAAEANRQRPDYARASGDQLTELYVRAAAGAAAKLPPAVGPKAFLLAVAIGVGDATAVERGLQQREVRQIENGSSRAVRLAVLGRPTVAGRRDLAQHFFVSAGLTAGAGAAHADALGYAKEALDAQGRSGFSFVDLAADRAGVRFAEKVLAGRFRLRTLSEHFRVEHYMPPTTGLPEGLTGGEVARRFGGLGDERFDKQMADIDSRIDALPPYTSISVKP